MLTGVNVRVFFANGTDLTDKTSTEAQQPRNVSSHRQGEDER